MSVLVVAEHQGNALARRRRLAWIGWPVLAIAIVLSALTVSGDELGDDWFADEMWRANFVRSPHWWDLYTSWDTPTPPGFVLLLRAWSIVLPNGPLALRLFTQLTLVATMLLIARLLLDVVHRAPGTNDSDTGTIARPPTSMIGMQVAVLVAVVVAPLIMGLGIHRTFVPYFLETAVAAGMLLSFERRHAQPSMFTLLLVLLIAAPLFTIGAMFFVPGIAVTLVVEAIRTGDTRRAWLCGAASTVSALVVACVYVFAYRPVTKPTIHAYWRAAALDGDIGRFPQLARDTIEQVRDGLIGWSHPTMIDGLGPLTQIVTVAAVAAGAVSLGRRWPAFVAVLASAWLCIVAASFAVGWPMTAERVNLAVFVFVYVTAIYGAVRLGCLVLRRDIAVAIASFPVAVFAFWPSDKTPLFGDAFLRGLTGDLRTVAATEATDNLVITYHFATRWYAQDALVTNGPDDATFRLVYETYTDRRVYDPGYLDDIVSSMPSGSAVWCVIPFDVGPDDSARACPVPTTLNPIIDAHGTRSDIRGYLVP